MIYKAIETDIPAIAGMAALLWEESTEAELAAEYAEIIHSDECAVFLSIDLLRN